MDRELKTELSQTSQSLAGKTKELEQVQQSEGYYKKECDNYRAKFASYMDSSPDDIIKNIKAEVGSLQQQLEEERKVTSELRHVETDLHIVGSSYGVASVVIRIRFGRNYRLFIDIHKCESFIACYIRCQITFLTVFYAYSYII